MDVTRGQGDINLHVISGAVIEWMQKWRAVACCCCVPRLSSGVCIRARASAAQCGTGSVAAGVKVARAVNSLILSLPLPLIYFPFSLILVYAAAPSSFPSWHPLNTPTRTHAHAQTHSRNYGPLLCEINTRVKGLCRAFCFTCKKNDRFSHPNPNPSPRVRVRVGGIWLPLNLRCSVHAFARGGSSKHMFVYLHRWIQAWMHKGSDYRIFYAINLSQRQNELKVLLDGSVMMFH